MFIVIDQINAADRPIMTQDAAQRERPTGAVWSFTKYDRLGRVVLTGEVGNTSSRAVLQGIIDAQSLPIGTAALYEVADTGGFMGYSAQSLPDHTVPSAQVLTVNYYDSYSFLSLPAIAAKTQISYFGLPSGASTESLAVSGLSTGSLVRILGTGDFLLSQQVYDDKGRISKTVSEHHLNGVDVITNSYNFAGELLSTNRQHYKGGSLALTTTTQQEYDHAGRVSRTVEQIDQQPPLHVDYTYNALGQLEHKKIGNQSITYAYNSRGWLSRMSSTLFGTHLMYDDGWTRPQAQYNGNIAEQTWFTGDTKTAYRYSYSYDPANRLISGTGSDGHGEIMQYDKMGNITSLVRTGGSLLPGATGSFMYDYGTQGNRLQSVSNGGTYNRNYQYNGQGSMVSDGHIKVSYNEAGLPNEITDMADIQKVSYIYDALGNKLTKVGAVETRHYIGGIEYTGGSAAAIDLIHTGEGIARKVGSVYHREYFLKDHLDNTRVVYDDGGEVLQRTDYLPFGMEINRKLTSPKVNYTYNGKELQDELGQYDYSFFNLFLWALMSSPD